MELDEVLSWLKNNGFSILETGNTASGLEVLVSTTGFSGDELAELERIARCEVGFWVTPASRKRIWVRLFFRVL